MYFQFWKYFPIKFWNQPRAVYKVSVFTHTWTHPHLPPLNKNIKFFFTNLMTAKWYLEFWFAFFYLLVKLNFPWYGYFLLAFYLLWISCLHPWLVSLLSISQHLAVFSASMFINPLYAKRTAITLLSFKASYPCPSEWPLFRQWLWIKIFAGLWGFVAIEVWAFNANALGDTHISYYKINASKNLPEVKQHHINLHSLS